MSGTIEGEVAFYDAWRASCVAIVQASGDRQIDALRQMTAAMASVLVEKAPEQAETIWDQSTLDVRLWSAKAPRVLARGEPLIRRFAPPSPARGEGECGYVLGAIFLAALFALLAIWGRG